MDCLWCFCVSSQPYLRYSTKLPYLERHASRKQNFLVLRFFIKLLHLSIFFAASLIAHFSYYLQLICNTQFAVFGMRKPVALPNYRLPIKNINKCWLLYPTHLIRLSDDIRILRKDLVSFTVSYGLWNITIRKVSYISCRSLMFSPVKTE